MHTHQARETWSVEKTREGLPHAQARLDKILAQLGRFWTCPPAARLLDIGCAQGLTLISAARLGLEAVGVEPWDQAREAAQQLAESEGGKVTVLDGVAEQLPLEAQSFDIVFSHAVMEHVDDAQAMLNEMYRVAKPGGVIWFSAASAMCPRQEEIAKFPMFGWYPTALKRKIMDWAMEHKPHLVNHTNKPAINWMTPGKGRRMLRAAGFQGRMYDYWDLRLESEGGTLHKYALRSVRFLPWGKVLAHMLVPAFALATVKQSS